MKQHRKWIKKKDCKLTPKELANELGNLRYDELSKFLRLLSSKIEVDSIKDFDRGRDKLGNSLDLASINLETASERIDFAWEICEPYMDVE
jgi:hypothetical protein